MKTNEGFSYQTPQKKQTKIKSIKQTPSLFSGDIKLLKKRANFQTPNLAKSETSSICSNNLNLSFSEFNNKNYLHNNLNFLSNSILETPSNFF